MGGASQKKLLRSSRALANAGNGLGNTRDAGRLRRKLKPPTGVALRMAKKKPSNLMKKLKTNSKKKNPKKNPAGTTKRKKLSRKLKMLAKKPVQPAKKLNQLAKPRKK